MKSLNLRLEIQTENLVPNETGKRIFFRDFNQEIKNNLQLCLNIGIEKMQE
jgi:hypothetical protein